MHPVTRTYKEVEGENWLSEAVLLTSVLVLWHWYAHIRTKEILKKDLKGFPVYCVLWDNFRAIRLLCSLKDCLVFHYVCMCCMSEWPWWGKRTVKRWEWKISSDWLHLDQTLGSLMSGGLSNKFKHSIIWGKVSGCNIIPVAQGSIITSKLNSALSFLWRNRLPILA